MQIVDENFKDDYLMLFMNDSDKEILCGLIESCLLMDTKIFLPFLKNKNVVTEMPNKMKFYREYKKRIECLHCNSSKKNHYKWEREEWMDDKSNLILKIYDDIHFYARLNFIIDKVEDKLYIEFLPF